MCTRHITVNIKQYETREQLQAKYYASTLGRLSPRMTMFMDLETAQKSLQQSAERPLCKPPPSWSQKLTDRVMKRLAKYSCRGYNISIRDSHSHRPRSKSFSAGFDTLNSDRDHHARWRKAELFTSIIIHSHTPARPNPIPTSSSGTRRPMSGPEGKYSRWVM